jgi:hypothetical protein
MGVLPRTTTKLCFFALAAIGFVIIVLFGRCAMAECLSSAAQVRAEHGVAAWSTWHYVDGHKCYMEGQRHGRGNSRLSAVATVGPNNLDDVVSRKQTPKRVAHRSRQPVALASVDIIDSVVGVVADERCAVGCLQPQSFEVVQVKCDDNCLRLWESFAILESMERLLPYRVRAAARDEAYTRWESQR